MAKITIIDDCMPYRRVIELKYSGPEPYKISKAMWEDMKTFFQVSTSGVAFTHLYWDDSGDPVTFFMRWWMKKKFSRMTRMELNAKSTGDKRKADNTGSFSLSMRSKLTTEYSTWLPGPLAKLMWEIYSYLFYNKARQMYIKQCQELTVSYKDFVADKFGLKHLPYENSWGGYQ